MYELTDEEFDKFKDICQRMLGIKLCESKKSLVISRLSSRLKSLKFTSFSEYIHYLATDTSGKEITTFVNKITTNETFFFREGKHFEYMESTMVPEWIQVYKRTHKPVRIWSAASSTGEEPYSIIMTVMNSLKNSSDLDFKLMGSDINTDVLEKARKGEYKSEAVHKYMNKNLITKFFDVVNESLYVLKPEVKKHAVFKQINLQAERYPLKEKVNLIFCRNVMIYFDKDTKQKLIDRFYDHLVPGGYLIMGQSENLFTYEHKFKSIQNTIYKKE